MSQEKSPLDQFAHDFHQEVLATAGDDANPRFREDAFTGAVLELLAEHNETDGAELSYHEAKSMGRVPAAKLNAWALSGDGATLDLFISRYHGGGTIEEVGLPETRRHFQLVRGFLRRALDGFHTKMEEASDAFAAAHQIHEARDSLSSVRLFFLTDGVVRSMDIEEETFPDVEVRYVVWDLEKLSRLRVGVRQIIELDFVRNFGGAIPCLETCDATNEYRTFLACLPATLIARIYSEHGQRLLERNVRAFLQAKNKVNRGLQKTLKEEPHRFLAYNNGLCCTAAEVRVQSGRDGHARLEWVKDFQIVNGGQTTASIHHAVRKEKTNISKVVVQMKLTVLTDPAKVAEIVPLISRYANSQNKVNTADFAAHGPFHLKLEELSRMVWAPAQSGLERGTHWYYERARGSYLDDKARQGTQPRRRDWEAQNPTKQKFTKTDLAKFVHAWTGNPHWVCLGAEKSFGRFAEEMEEIPDWVPDEDTFKRIIALAIVFRASEQIVSEQDFGGYRANITAYTVSWLATHTEHRLNLLQIWRRQQVSSTESSVFSEIAKKAFDHLNDTPSDRRNIGEWSKQKQCWEQFKKTKIAVSRSLQSELVPEDETWSFWRGLSRATEAQEIEMVQGIRADYWFGLAKWAKEQDCLEPWQRSLAFSIGKLAASGRPPSEKQAYHALKILREATGAGHPAP